MPLALYSGGRLVVHISSMGAVAGVLVSLWLRVIPVTGSGEVHDQAYHGAWLCPGLRFIHPLVLGSNRVSRSDHM